MADKAEVLAYFIAALIQAVADSQAHQEILDLLRATAARMHEDLSADEFSRLFGMVNTFSEKVQDKTSAEEAAADFSRLIQSLRS